MNLLKKLFPVGLTIIRRSVLFSPNEKNVIKCAVIHYSPLHTSRIFLCHNKDTMEKQNISKEELKKKLSPLQYHVTQEKGTERPFTGKFNKTTDEGIYTCIVCGLELFSSDTKYDSGCGWPAFNDVLDKGLVKLSKDTSTGTIRTEVQCARCDAHLGHVFADGPKPTGKRFCINSASLDFKAAASKSDK